MKKSNMEYLLQSEEETKKFAEKLSKKIKPGSIIALRGDLGSGKTTFTRYLVDAFGIEARVQSPTFVIVRRYKGDDLTVNHVDLYRLTSVQEVEDIGLVELINEESSITIIEWPERAKNLLPDDTKVMDFEYVDETVRKVKCINF